METDENRKRVERGEKRREKRGDLLLPIHMPWQETGHRNKRHAKEHECLNDL
jgi:hypothetical protein